MEIATWHGTALPDGGVECERWDVSEVPAPSRQVVRFGAFELDLRVGELRKAGLRVKLQEQPFKVLECLVERPGELITREELRQRLWQGETFVDFEHGVNAAVKRLRETLGDSAETPRFIETLPRRGYRLIAPVERDQPPIVEADLATTGRGGADQRLQAAAEPAHPKRWSDRLIGASVLGILVTAAVGGWVLSRSSSYGRWLIPNCFRVRGVRLREPPGAESGS